MTATSIPNTKRAANKRSSAGRSATKTAAAPSIKRLPSRKNGRPTPPLALPHIDIEIDWSRRDAFLKLPLEERDRRLEAFRAALAPAFADYSSDDFRADQRREAERD